MDWQQASMKYTRWNREISYSWIIRNITRLAGFASQFHHHQQAIDCPDGEALLVVDQPFKAYLTIVRHFRPSLPQTKNISDTAVIGEELCHRTQCVYCVIVCKLDPIA
jgi:hypothetical protein